MIARRSAALAAALAALAVPTVVACGETIDLRDQEATTVPEPEAAPPDTAAVPADGSLHDLLPLLVDSWRGLDQRVIDEDAAEPMARIEQIWALAEPQLRADHPATLFGYQQAVDLARSAVDRRRPADASKGYRLVIELTDDLLTR